MEKSHATFTNLFSNAFCNFFHNTEPSMKTHSTIYFGLFKFDQVKTFLTLPSVGWLNFDSVKGIITFQKIIRKYFLLSHQQ